MIFEQYGAPHHYSAMKRQYLEQKSTNRWTGRAGPIHWSPRLPEFTPCNYFLCSGLKDIVYRKLRSKMEELKNKVMHSIQTVNNHKLKNVYENLKSRFCFLLTKKSGHFENLLS